ncbi:hypothetical protein D9M68_704750 [compost metagenome]
MTALRTQWGIDLDYIKAHFGLNYANHTLQQAKSFIEQESLRLSEGVITLSDKGKLYADGIAAHLFMEND